jgi:putative oxidoreductase
MMDVPPLRWKARPHRRQMRGDGRWGAPDDRSGQMNLDERTTTPYAALLLRVTLGLAFLAHGLLLKVMTFGLGGTMGFFGSIGYPPVFGAIVAIAEIAGGLALIAGIRVRTVSLLFLPIMIGATIQHLPNGWLFTGQGGGWEFPAMWTVLLLVQAGLGAGAHALSFGRAALPARA